MQNYNHATTLKRCTSINAYTDYFELILNENEFLVRKEIDLTETQEWLYEYRIFFHAIINVIVEEYIDSFNNQDSVREYIGAFQKLVRAYRYKSRGDIIAALKSTDSAFVEIGREILTAHEKFYFSDVRDVDPLAICMHLIEMVKVYTPQLEYYKISLALSDFKYDRSERKYYSDGVESVAYDLKRAAEHFIEGNDYEIYLLDGFKHTVDHLPFFDIVDSYYFDESLDNMYENIYNVLLNAEDTKEIATADKHYREIYREIFKKDNPAILKNIRSWIRTSVDMFVETDYTTAVNVIGNLFRETVIATKKLKLKKADLEQIKVLLSDSIKLLIYFLEGCNEASVLWAKSVVNEIRPLIDYKNKDTLVDLYEFDEYIAAVTKQKSAISIYSPAFNF